MLQLPKRLGLDLADALARDRELLADLLEGVVGRRADAEAHAQDALLSDHGLVGSMARRGNPYDNAMMESFMKTLKVEGVYPMAFESEEDVACHLPCFIDSYNVRWPRKIGQVAKVYSIA